MGLMDTGVAVGASAVPGGGALVSGFSAVKGLFTRGTSAGKESERLRGAGWKDIGATPERISALKRATGMDFREDRKERFWENDQVPGFMIAKFGNASEKEWAASKLAAIQAWPNVGHEDWILILRKVGDEYSPVQAYQDVTSLPTASTIQAAAMGKPNAMGLADMQAGTWDGKPGMSTGTMIAIVGGLGLVIFMLKGQRGK